MQWHGETGRPLEDYCKYKDKTKEKLFKKGLQLQVQKYVNRVGNWYSQSHDRYAATVDTA